MTSLTAVLRRFAWLLALGATGGAVWAWWRDRSAASPAPAEWPPLRIVDDDATPQDVGDAPEQSTPTPDDADLVATAPAATLHVVATDWVDPDEEGGCPLSHPVKANDNSGIFHVPGGRFYDRTKAERCYATAEQAEQDGYRPAKS